MDKSTPIQLMGLLVVGFIMGKQLELDWMFPAIIVVVTIIVTIDITINMVIPMFKKETRKDATKRIKEAK